MAGAVVRAAVVASVVVATLTGCRDGTVELTFRPSVGDEHRYRYEVAATVTRTVGSDPARTSHVDSQVEVHQRVVEVDDQGAVVALTVTRGGNGSGTVLTRIDRSGLVASDDILGGLPAALDPGSLVALVPEAVAAPPREPLEPGHRWDISGSTGPGAGEDAEGVRDADVSGRGRLVRLGTIDGTDVAVVRTQIEVPVEGEISTEVSPAVVSGRQTTRSEIAYDVDDGVMRRMTSATTGRARARVAPPEGLIAEPVPVELVFEVHVRAERLA